MAHRGLKALSAESAVELANRSASGRALSTVVLGLPAPEDGGEEDAPNIALGYLVYVRQGGFLVVLPVAEEIRSCLDNHGLQVSSAPAYKTGELDIETARGRGLGREQVDMVDMSWSFIGLFAASTGVRGFRDARVLQIKVGGEMGRPTKGSACDMANEWISSMMPAEIAQEYLTGEEFEDEEQDEELQADQPAVAAPMETPETAALRARVQELEQLMKANSKTSGEGSTVDSGTYARAAECSGLGATPAFGWTTTKSRSSRNSEAKPHLGSPKCRQCVAYDGTRGGGDCSGRGSNQCSDGSECRPHSAVAFCSASSESGAAGKVDGSKACRPTGQHAGRVGQRRRQWKLWCARLHSSGLLRADYDGCDQACRDLRAERHEGVGFSPREGRRILDAEVRGTENASAGESLDDLCGFHDGRCLVAGAFQQQPRAHGHCWQGFDVPGTSSFGSRSASTSLVAHRPSRPSVQPSAVQQKEDRTISLQQTGGSAWIAANLAFVKDIDMLESKTLAMQKGAKPGQEENADVDPKPKRPPKNPKGKWKEKGPDDGTSTN